MDIRTVVVSLAAVCLAIMATAATAQQIPAQQGQVPQAQLSQGQGPQQGQIQESQIRVGPIDAVLTMPPNVERPPVALLIAGSGSTDHDGNGPQAKPATLKKLSEQLLARGIATLRYDKRGAGGWKPAFGRPEDFRFKDYV